MKFKGVKQLFLAQVACGVSRDLGSALDRSLRRPPINDLTGLRFDSITGTPGVAKMYVLYDNTQAYPLFLVDYIA